MANYNESCRGCVYYKYKVEILKCTKNRKAGYQCPCSICIVKTMCRKDCDEFSVFCES